MFTTQLEKSRDSVSVANLRSAYAQAQTEALTATASSPDSNTSDVKVVVTAAATGTGGATDTAARLNKVIVRDVSIKSQKANDWSGLAQELPFYKLLKSGDSEDTTNHLDAGQNGYVTVTFTYTSAGKDLDIEKVEISKRYNGTHDSTWTDDTY